MVGGGREGGGREGGREEGGKEEGGRMKLTCCDLKTSVQDSHSLVC